MKKLINPYTRVQGYNCFACSPDNDHGLKLEFFDEGAELVSYFTACDHHQGYRDILHGGIQTTLMDEIASWYIQAKLGTAGVTARMNVRLLKPLHISKGPVKISGRLKEQENRFVTIDARLFDGEGQLCAEGDIVYMVFNPEMAKQKLYYPGPESFYGE